MEQHKLQTDKDTSGKLVNFRKPLSAMELSQVLQSETSDSSDSGFLHHEA